MSSRSQEQPDTELARQLAQQARQGRDDAAATWERGNVVSDGEVTSSPAQQQAEAVLARIRERRFQQEHEQERDLGR